MKTTIKIKAELPVSQRIDKEGNIIFSDANGVDIISYTKKGDLFDLFSHDDVSMMAPRCVVRTSKNKNGDIKIQKVNDVIFDSKLISLGVAIQLPDGFMSEVHPRSSTFGKKHIMLTNSEGQIDNSYKGNNDIWKFGAIAFEDTNIKKGDKIAQFRIHLSQHATFWQKLKWLLSSGVNVEFVNSLEGDNRGGFGSTGGYK